MAAVVTSALLLFVPAYGPGHRSIVDVNGIAILSVFLVPVLMALVPVVWRRPSVRLLTVFLLTAFVFIGSASIGLFYAPTAVIAVLAALTEDETTD